MNTKRIVPIAGIVSAFALGLVVAYQFSTSANDQGIIGSVKSSVAQTLGGCKCDGEGMGGKHGRMGGMGRMEMRGIEQYIDIANLTGEAKTTFETAKTAHETKVKAIFEKYKDATDKTAMKTELDAARKEFLTSLTTLVATDKQADYAKFIETAPTMGEGMGEGRGMGRMEMRGIEQYIDIANLTGEAKTTFETAKTAHETKVKAIFEKYKDVTDKTAMKTELDAARKEFLTSLTALVATDKQADYAKFIETAPTMGKGMGGRHGGKGMMGGRGMMNNQSSSQENSQ